MVDTAWLEKHGYRRQWREKYVAQGWLEGVVRGAYQRPTGNVDQAIAWQRVIISLQRLLDKSVHVGGRSALELQGLTHYLRLSGKPEIHLYAYVSLPGWVERIPTDAQFVEHKADKLFDADAPGRTRIAWGHWGWELDLSAPERALCELLDLLPSRETFHQADVLMESVRTLSPKRVQAVLEACRSVKVKRLFLWFAERHAHPWFGRLDLKRIDLGRGKRQIVVGGRLDTSIKSLCRRHSMPASEAYRAQVSLLVRVLPLVAEENVFALKGGTAINLFV
ncbi:Transcriptional regulator, AbiEi antitoxin, Type IV TA system [Rhizobium miluonense]|uniref:Transcriptional regulator, AbiEi antitoxin, Type IV TA system n=1 Tax=Rhizobium miluonense TaxID=411945 RepID=A0A1C3W4L6_9HYPH|nr:Transcriptional regulator, AbiEi antitoxin, Type IV TA system [Rhizobium miluonense]